MTYPTSPNLDTLRVEFYDECLLNQLTNNVHLSDLRISNGNVDTRFVEAIASCPRLRSLNLERTNVDDASLARFDSLKNLSRLGLIGTDVDLSTLGSPRWSGTMKSLMVGRGSKEEREGLTIEDWPKLAELTIFEYEGRSNSKTMKVKLANVPSLTHLRMDRCQAAGIAGPRSCHGHQCTATRYNLATR